MDADHVFCRNGDPSSFCRTENREVILRRDAIFLRPLVDGVQIDTDRIRQESAGPPLFDQVGGGIDFQHTAPDNGRFFHSQVVGASFMEDNSTPLTRERMSMLRASPSLQETSARVVAVREALGMGKGEFADSIGVDRSSWTKIEKGEKPLHADHAYRISERYSVPMDFLVSRCR